jgi:hypothetical protein
VVPLASALVAHRDRYFSLLESYRAGDVRPLMASFADSCRIAAVESRATASRLAAIPSDWQGMLGGVRSGSAAAKLLALLPSRPVLAAEDACAAIDSPNSSIYAAIERLRDAGVLRPLTERKREPGVGCRSDPRRAGRPRGADRARCALIRADHPAAAVLLVKTILGTS